MSDPLPADAALRRAHANNLARVTDVFTRLAVGAGLAANTRDIAHDSRVHDATLETGSRPAPDGFVHARGRAPRPDAIWRHPGSPADALAVAVAAAGVTDKARTAA